MQKEKRKKLWFSFSDNFNWMISILKWRTVIVLSLWSLRPCACSENAHLYSNHALWTHYTSDIEILSHVKSLQHLPTHLKRNKNVKLHGLMLWIFIMTIQVGRHASDYRFNAIIAFLLWAEIWLNQLLLAWSLRAHTQNENVKSD